MPIVEIGDECPQSPGFSPKQAESSSANSTQIATPKNFT
jgi:hypothetical protein